MKIIGWVMAIIAAIVIIYNVATTAENEATMRDHPWITMFSGGANLKKAYTFTPPYTGFEITIISIGVTGVGLIVFGPSKHS